MRARLSVLLLLCSVPMLMAERCGPAGSISPAFTKDSVVADDALPGKYVAVSAADDTGSKGKLPRATITRDDVDGAPSYLLELDGDPSVAGVKLRLVEHAIGAARFVDLVAEDHSKGGELAKSMSFPEHLHFRVEHPAGGGVTLSYLSAKWVDTLLAADGGAAKGAAPLAMRELSRRYRKANGEVTSGSESVLLSDTPALQALLTRAAAAPDAWELGLELVRAGTPVLRFTLTAEEREHGAIVATETFTVVGSRIERTRTTAAGSTRARGVVTDPAALDALVKAVGRAAKAPAPKGAADAHTMKTCLDGARCTERVIAASAGASDASSNGPSNAPSDTPEARAFAALWTAVSALTTPAR